MRMLLLSLGFLAVHVDAYNPIKYKNWYLFARDSMEEAAHQCQIELEGYWNQTQLNPPRSPCGLAQNCLLDALREYSKANYATAAILLGLTPTMLGFTGPVLQDTAILIINRPILTSLIVIGAPATSPIPLLSHAVDTKLGNPSAVMLAAGQHFSINTSANPRTRSAMVLLAALQYLLALGAVANTIHTAIELDYQSVVIWHCSSVGYPVGWVLTSVLIHWVSAIGLWCRARMGKAAPETHRVGNSTSILSNLSAIFRRWLAREFIPSLFQPLPEWISHIGPATITSNLLSWLSSLMLLAHYAMGTLVFSSFLFIGTPDAGFILCRLGVSALICRLVLWLEYDSLCMRSATNHRLHGSGSSINLEPSRPLTAHENK